MSELTTRAILAQKGDIVQFCSEIGQISREKEQDWVDVLQKVFCLVRIWGDFRSQMIYILYIMGALRRTFQQEIYTKKRTWRQEIYTKKRTWRKADAQTPHSRNYILARPILVPFLPRNCQISTRIFNWDKESCLERLITGVVLFVKKKKRFAIIYLGL